MRTMIDTITVAKEYLKRKEWKLIDNDIPVAIDDDGDLVICEVIESTDKFSEKAPYKMTTSEFESISFDILKDISDLDSCNVKHDVIEIVYISKDRVFIKHWHDVHY